MAADLTAAIAALAGLATLVIAKVWKSTSEKRETKRLEDETQAERFVREAREFLKTKGKD